MENFWIFTEIVGGKFRFSFFFSPRSWKLFVGGEEKLSLEEKCFQTSRKKKKTTSRKRISTDGKLVKSRRKSSTNFFFFDANFFFTAFHFQWIYFSRDERNSSRWGKINASNLMHCAIALRMNTGRQSGQTQKFQVFGKMQTKFICRLHLPWKSSFHYCLPELSSPPFLVPTHSIIKSLLHMCNIITICNLYSGCRQKSAFCAISCFISLRVAFWCPSGLTSNLCRTGQQNLLQNIGDVCADGKNSRQSLNSKNWVAV